MSRMLIKAKPGTKIKINDDIVFFIEKIGSSQVKIVLEADIKHKVAIEKAPEKDQASDLDVVK